MTSLLGCSQEGSAGIKGDWISGSYNPNYTLVNYHSNGKSSICIWISYWKRSISIAMLVFQRVIYLRSTPLPVTVTTRIITFLVGNPYKPSFATVTGWGVDPSKISFISKLYLQLIQSPLIPAPTLFGTSTRSDCIAYVLGTLRFFGSDLVMSK